MLNHDWTYVIVQNNETRRAHRTPKTQSTTTAQGSELNAALRLVHNPLRVVAILRFANQLALGHTVCSDGRREGRT